MGSTDGSIDKNGVGFAQRERLNVQEQANKFMKKCPFIPKKSVSISCSVGLQSFLEEGLSDINGNLISILEKEISIYSYIPGNRDKFKRVASGDCGRYFDNELASVESKMRNTASTLITAHEGGHKTMQEKSTLFNEHVVSMRHYRDVKMKRAIYLFELDQARKRAALMVLEAAVKGSNAECIVKAARDEARR